MKFLIFKLKNQKGVSLYLAVVIMSILLALSLGISGILYSQLKVSKGMGNSVLAFYAANTGIERAIYEIHAEEKDLPYSFSSTTDNGSNYSVQVLLAGGDDECPTSTAKYYCVKSTGTFNQVSRAIFIGN